ncbi:MAG: type 4a pilus biogenesis protein PilO [Actinomycetota bacterium]
MRRGRIVLVALVMMVLSALFYVFFIRARQAELAEVRADIDAAEQQTVQLQAELARLQELQANAPELEALLATFRQLVPPRNEVPNYIFLIQDIANRSGVRFLSITPQLPKAPLEGAALADITMAITGDGGYFALQDFLRRLEDLDRASRIDNIALVGQTEEGGATEVGLSITVRIFFDLPEVPAAVGAVPGAEPTPPPGG